MANKLPIPRTGMMSRKTEYNARFCFDDPLSKLSLSRSSRYHIRKRRRHAEAIAAGEPSESPVSDTELDCCAQTMDDDPSITYDDDEQEE